MQWSGLYAGTWWWRTLPDSECTEHSQYFPPNSPIQNITQACSALQSSLTQHLVVSSHWNWSVQFLPRALTEWQSTPWWEGDDVVRADLKDAAAWPEPGLGHVAPPVSPRYRHHQTSQSGRNQTGSHAEFSLRKEFNLEFGTLLFIKYLGILYFSSFLLFSVNSNFSCRDSFWC